MMAMVRTINVHGENDEKAAVHEAVDLVVAIPAVKPGVSRREGRRDGWRDREWWGLKEKKGVGESPIMSYA